MKTKERVFAVFGLGLFGKTVAEVLVERGAEVFVVDSNADNIEAFKNKVTTALLMDATDEVAMTKAPLEDIDIAVVAVESVETSIIITAILKKRGIPYIVGRALTDIHAQVLTQIGANEVINLQEDEGIRVATRLIAPEVLDSIQITKEYSLVELYIPQDYIGKELQSLALQEKYGFRLIGIRRTEMTIDADTNPIRIENLVFPKETDLLLESDILLVVGKNAGIEAFKSLF